MSGDHNMHQADHIFNTAHLTQCATCGYPLTEDEQAGLVEINGKMHKPWVYLTFEEIDQLFSEYDSSNWYEFVREVENKLKEKNT